MSLASLLAHSEGRTTLFAVNMETFPVGREETLTKPLPLPLPN